MIVHCWRSTLRALGLLVKMARQSFGSLILEWGDTTKEATVSRIHRHSQKQIAAKQSCAGFTAIAKIVTATERP